MRICFLVLAHHQPEVFQRLLKQISSPEDDVVVHIDRRTDLRKFVTPGFPNVHYLKPRRKVFWASWKQAKTIIRMLKFGLKVSSADYFIFLAGTDFPIKPIGSLRRHLEGQHPANFLNWYPLVPGAWGYHLTNGTTSKACLLDSSMYVKRWIQTFRQFGSSR